MAYRRPGVIVTQEFQNAAPALAAFALPCCVIGPAYQVVNNDLLGTYSGAEQTYAYAGLLGGAVVDLSFTAEDEMFPATKKQLSGVMRNTIIQVLAEQTNGSGAGDVLTDDSSPTLFADVVAGDIVTIVEETGVEIVAAQTDGVTTDTAGQRNRLTAGVVGQFAQVKAGDEVVVTAGTNTNTGTYLVTAKLSDSLLLLDADVNDGVGASTDVAYSISGDRGTTNQGDYVIKSKTDDNTLVLQTPFLDTPEAPLTYSIKRRIGEIEVEYLDSPGNGFTADADGVTLPLGLQTEVDSTLYDVLSGTFYASYRALRNDLAAEVREYEGTTDLTSVFGSGQLVPSNPLGYGLSIMLQNTVTPVNGLGLDENAVTDEVLSYTAATEVLETTEMYALAPLSQSPVVHTLFKNHVDQLSQPQRKQERVVLISSLLKTTLLLQEEQTTVTTANNSRVIVNTQVDGSGSFVTNPAVLNDATPDAFLNVALGDSVVIVGGTNVNPGTYVVTTKTSDNSLTLASSFITAGTPTDIQYYIYRRDGLSAGGLIFYDRNAAFLANGVAAGHYIEISGVSFEGRYKIGSVQSDRQLTLATAIPGIVSLQTGITYEINRDLTKAEQAAQVASYSEAFADRRVVHCWPDVLQAPVGSETEDVPGFYGACTIAALTSGLPTQQGFTNLAVSGFLGFKHSTRYFTEAQLDTIAGGGTLIFAQDTPDTPLYVRHQLTTDLSSIKFQEYSVTKNVDFMAKHLRSTYAPYIGQYNIIDTTLDALKTTGEGEIIFLRDTTRVPRFGGVIRAGKLVSLTESETQIDTVDVLFNFQIPIPLNNIDITIQV
jgi:hypothetical protein